MPPANVGFCDRCRRRVPVSHQQREGKVYLVKDCPDCGTTEALISSNAALWQRKRDLYKYQPTGAGCEMQCRECTHQHHPRMVFVEVTNRCNMNCPICIANIPTMGFRFDPPLAYFEKVLAEVARMEPPPVVHLFGGEPTVREDLFDIIDIAHRHGLRVHVNTNGLRLEDEEYCKALVEKDVAVLFSCDGRDPEIDRKLRGVPSACARRLKGLDNLKKHSRKRWNIIMCCVARHINDQHIADLFQFCHDHTNHIKGLYFIPLTETWEPGAFEADVSTTIEDVQEIVDDAFPDDAVEYLSLGLQHHLNRVLSFLGVGARQTFPNIHPNCEAGTHFFSDGTRYRPLSYFLKRPLEDVAAEAIRRAQKIDPKLAKLDPGDPAQRRRGQRIVLTAFAGLLLKAPYFKRIIKGSRWLGLARILGGLLLGKSLKEQLRKHTWLRDGLASIILPFEEHHSLESERLYKCGAGFAFEDPVTGRVGTIPVCTWTLYKDDIMRGITAKYGTASGDKAASPAAAAQELS